MSKIARVFHLNKEIQKIYKNGVLQKLFFDWKKYIGEEINIEYARGYCSNRISINGKVYQNLYDMKNLTYNYYDTFTEDGYKNINIPELSTGYKVCKSAVNNLIKANTVYTIIIDVRKNTYNKNFGINSDYGNEGYFSKNISIQQNFIGRMIVTATSKETLPSSGQKVFRTQITPDSLGEIEYKLTLLEGDLSQETITENSIKYLKEGCSELRNLTIQGKTYQNLVDINSYQNVTGINLVDNKVEYQTTETQSVGVINPISIKSNTKYTLITDILDINDYEKPYIIRVTDENNKWSLNLGSINANTIGKKFLVFTTPSDLTYFKILLYNSSFYDGIKFTFPILLEGEYTNTDIPDSINGIESVGEREFVNTPTEYYPVTIRNYNYKCGTDNIILPNGVKNSIDTIDGKKVHTRRVGAVLLNGTQDMTLSNVNQTLTTRVRIRMDNAKVSKNNLLCNWFIRTEAHGDYEYIIIQDSSEGICLFISVLNTKLSAPTADGVKQYFSENPLWVFYELATPTYTYLESGLYDDITIPTPSNIRNEIYLENGKWYHKRNIGKVIFDGSSDEKWSHYKEGSWARFDIKMPNDAKMYSTRKPVYAVGYQFDASKNEDKIIFISGVVDSVNKLYIYNYAYTTVADFRAYLAENPLEVYYELAEPVISELYFNDITYKINEPLRGGLPNGVCDNIEETKLVQRVGKVLLDGSLDEEWVVSNKSNGLLNVEFLVESCVKKSRNTNDEYYYFCDKLPNQNTSISDTKTEGVMLHEKKVYIRIFLDKLDSQDVDGLRTWLAENPITVYYELETPIETEITPNNILINGEVITDTSGIKLPNGTKDIIEEGYYIKRVGNVTYNGQEDWKLGATTADTKVFYLVNTNLKELSSLVCDTYTAQTTSKDKSIYCGNAWRPQIRDDSCTTVEEFKQLLSENPVTVWYELATPVKIPLFLIKEGLNTLKSTNNITPQLELDCLVRDDFQNLCDNIWESGDIAVDSGVEYSSSTSRIKLHDYIAVQPNTTYYCDTSSETVYSTTGKIGVRYYKNDKTFISGGGIGIAKTSYNKFTTPEDCYYIKFIVETLDTNYKMYLRPVK